ncbi:hypothetical protein FraEuI1c_0242 [Pseudofrankia inefficax]|uniref:Microcin J25-processing protein McjB C-terminal domain-containing protein n=2 Tax=Pseudofrankia inefficax (strain DSM 45817 / CECT 9037 / DDB 130130 / EuI1c) TaxID=298654 RepID=E3J637_PSEI1|nr:hypothetical protein FraEuI1c_0242 [Pseudofrankia inefficax]
MTMPMSMRRRTPAPPLTRRLLASVAVVAARALATQPPARIHAVLTAVSRGARPASLARTETARADVVAVSLVCRGARGCVPRSIATALLCRMSGSWPTWHAGVRSVAPFAAHAWVEAGGQLVGEEEPPGYFRPLMTVPPPARTGPSTPDQVRVTADPSAEEPGSRRHQAVAK